MSFLHKLWDETLAGPAPDSGLSRLRKYNSFSASRSPPMLTNDRASNIPRRIEIPSPTLSQNSSTTTTPPPTPPETPRGDDMNRLARRRTIDYPRRRPLEGSDPTSTPSVYDWIVITALDR
ncbi:dormancy-associated protein homolog 4-like [Cucurbita moschata]|uniref:Dormancy-associated protein homolog 4-like n=1 Tax=Cucurbita moschata TaxID=3662 RepID=A0A6J1GCS2_CUCMO|nr:dormancy-associated protein homolog 4-like [Cucurbita moschata]